MLGGIAFTLGLEKSGKVNSDWDNRTMALPIETIGLPFYDWDNRTTFFAIGGTRWTRQSPLHSGKIQNIAFAT